MNTWRNSNSKFRRFLHGTRKGGRRPRKWPPWKDNIQVARQVYLLK